MSMKRKIVSALLTLCLIFGMCGFIPQQAQAAKTYTVDNLKYQIKDAGKCTCIIVGGKNKNITKVYHDDGEVYLGGKVYTVVGIKKGAFKNYKKIKTVVFDGCDDDEITAIPDNCFTGCTALKEVTLDPTINKIGKNTFKGCKKLAKISIFAKGMKQNSFGKNSFKGTKKGIKVEGDTTAYAKKYVKFIKKCGAKNPKAVESKSNEDDEDDE